MPQKKKRKAKKEMLSEFGNFSNPKESKTHGVFDENGRVRFKFPAEQVRCECRCCRFEGPVWEFTMSYSKYHDIRCPQCGSVNIDTSQVSGYWNNYGFGKNNRLKKSFLKKNEKPIYGD